MKNRIIFYLLNEVHILDLAGPLQVFYESGEYGIPYEILFVSDQPKKQFSSGLFSDKLINLSEVTPVQGDILIIPGFSIPSNIEINKSRNINLQQGKITEVKLTGKFDIILANINKNVLLAEMNTYASYLTPKGLLLLSGFYVHDIPDLLNEASKYNLKERKRDEKETWASLLLEA